MERAIEFQGESTYIVLNSSRYSSSPLFSLINKSNLSMSSLSTSRKDPRAACPEWIKIEMNKYYYLFSMFYNKSLLNNLLFNIIDGTVRLFVG